MGCLISKGEQNTSITTTATSDATESKIENDNTETKQLMSQLEEKIHKLQEDVTESKEDNDFLREELKSITKLSEAKEKCMVNQSVTMSEMMSVMNKEIKTIHATAANAREQAHIAQSYANGMKNQVKHITKFVDSFDETKGMETQNTK